MSNSKIVSARITDMPRSMFDPMPQVWVKTEGSDEEQKLFEYYPDEIRFSPDEFVGLSLEEGKRLKFNKDVDFLKN